jgi:SET domain-containing protein
VYKPLPDGLYVSNSDIAGQGLFTNRKLEIGTELGLSHKMIDDNLIRTPLGGFINHSEEPNVQKYQIGNDYFIKVIKDINPGEEITLKYNWYNPVTDND